VKACEEIRQSIIVNVPVTAANLEWTRFTLWNIYHHSSRRPDEGDAESGSGFVRLEAIDDHTTRMTVDLNYCPHYKGISDREEIAQVQQHLSGTLGRYKEFVESHQA
jgi:hypothetical protein